MVQHATIRPQRCPDLGMVIDEELKLQLYVTQVVKLLSFTNAGPSPGKFQWLG